MNGEDDTAALFLDLITRLNTNRWVVNRKSKGESESEAVLKESHRPFAQHRGRDYRLADPQNDEGYDR